MEIRREGPAFDVCQHIHEIIIVLELWKAKDVVFRRDSDRNLEILTGFGGGRCYRKRHIAPENESQERSAQGHSRSKEDTHNDDMHKCVWSCLYLIVAENEHSLYMLASTCMEGNQNAKKNSTMTGKKRAVRD